MNELRKNEYYCLYMCLHFSEIVNEYVKCVSNVHFEIKNLLNGVFSRNKQLKRKIKEKMGAEFNEVFPELSSERIYILMDLADKTSVLSENQLKELVESIKIEEK